MPASQIIPAQPLITFIVTTYNLPLELVRECLDSINSLSLNKEQREIILVDDGSDISLLNELGETMNDIIYVRQPNEGLSIARNMGLKIATGKFIQFVDGDDCLIQREYEHCLDIIRYNEPVDMVLFYMADSKNQPVDLSFEGPVTGAKYMESHNIRAAACGYVFRADRLGDLRFTPGILHEDEEFTPQLMLRVHNLYTTSAKAYYYRKRNGSITNSSSKENKEKRLDDTLNIILRLKAMTGDIDDNGKRDALNRRVAQLTMDYLVNVIRMTRSGKSLDDAIKTLSEHGLYPLPDRHYTKKYTVFCHLTGSRIGRFILRNIL